MRTLLFLFSLLFLSCRGAGFEALFRKVLDQNGDNQLSRSEVERYLQSTEPEATVPESAVTRVMKLMDYNNDDVLDWNEFQTYFASLKREKVGDDVPPQQIHVGLTTDPTQVVIMWASSENTTAPQVQIGTQSGVYTQTFTGTTDGYNVSYPGDIDYVSLPIHTVLLTGLKTSALYYYRCGNQLLSQELNFTTAPPVGAIVDKVTWIMYGDMGTVLPLGFEVTKWIIQEYQSDPFDLILHVGDLAYAGTGSDREVEPVWDDWMNQIEPLASFIPYQVTVGNHEHYYNWTAFRHRFDMPFYNRAENEFWFSFDYANVHVVAMSMDSNPYNVGSPQYNWIENDLAQAYDRQQKSGTPGWIILSGHRPFLCSDSSEYDQHCPGAPLISTMEPLMLKYGVDLVITGHMHCYERTYPNINGTTNVPVGSNDYTNIGEPVYIVQGTAGAMIAEKWVQPEPSWSAYRKLEYGYGRVEITSNATASTLYYRFLGQNGVVVDQLWLRKTI